MIHIPQCKLGYSFNNNAVRKGSLCRFLCRCYQSPLCYNKDVQHDCTSGYNMWIANMFYKIYGLVTSRETVPMKKESY